MHSFVVYGVSKLTSFENRKEETEGKIIFLLNLAAQGMEFKSFKGYSRRRQHLTLLCNWYELYRVLCTYLITAEELPKVFFLCIWKRKYREWSTRFEFLSAEFSMFCAEFWRRRCPPESGQRALSGKWARWFPFFASWFKKKSVRGNLFGENSLSTELN